MERRITTLAIVLALTTAPAMLATNGYFMHGQGTTNKSMAGAGVALPQEAFDASVNPAAAAFIEHGYSLGLALFSPDRQYTITGNPSGYPQTFGLTPGTVTSKSKYFPLPSVAANFRPDDKSAVTVSFAAQGGMNTDYRTATFYGSDHTGVDLAQMFLNATYAKKVTANQSLGITLIGVTQRFRASGLQAFGGFSSDAANLTNNGYDWSFGAGVKVGYLARLTPKVSFGAAYMPQITMSRFDKYNGLFADGGGFNIPESISAGFTFKPAETVVVATDYERIHYSDVRSIGQHLMPRLMSAPLGNADGSGFGWNDVNVYKIGVQWQASQDWTLRAGFSKCNQPIPDSEVLFNILAPGVVEQHYTFGVSKALANGPGKFNLGVMYAPTKTVTGANPLEAPGQQNIQLKMQEYDIEFSYSVGF